MMNQLRLIVGSPSRILAVFVSLGLVGIFVLSIPSSAQLIIKEDYTLESPPDWGNNTLVYVREFQCVKVKEVNLQIFYLKAGKETEILDGDYSREEGDTIPSSSCLFTLISSSSFKGPWVKFNFYDGTNVGVTEHPLPFKKSLSEVEVRTPSKELSLSLGKPVLLYLKIYRNLTSPDVRLVVPRRLSSIQEVKDFSSKHQELECLAISLLWSK